MRTVYSTAALIAMLSISPTYAEASDSKACFRTTGAPQNSIRCFHKESAEQNGYHLSDAIPMEKRTVNPVDSKICFYPANAGFPRTRCYNREWVRANGYDISKGYNPLRYSSALEANSTTTTECSTRVNNGKPQRVCYAVPKVNF